MNGNLKYMYIVNENLKSRDLLNQNVFHKRRHDFNQEIIFLLDVRLKWFTWFCQAAARVEGMGAGVKGVEGGGSLVHHFGGMSGALHESLSVLE